MSIYRLILLFYVGFMGHVLHAQNPVSVPEYMRVRTASGTDTNVSVSKIKIWSIQANYAAFPLEIVDSPMMIDKSGIHGVGLFVKKGHTFAMGDTVLVAFEKKGNTGQFLLDYKESNPAYFVNHSFTPNCTLVKNAQHIYMIASAPIDGNTELTASYAQLEAMFPQDITLKSILVYPKR